MNAGAFHQFHDTGNEHIPSVADGIHFHLTAFDVLIHQNRLVFIDFHSGAQVMAKLSFVCNDLHGSAAQDEAGTNQHRISDFGGSGNTVFNLGNCASLGTGDVQLIQQVLKGITVLGPVNGCAVGTDDTHTPIGQGLCQVDCSLAAQRSNDTHRLLKLDDVHHIFGSQRLEIELVSGGIVSGNGLGVIVDDDCFITGVLNGHNGVNSGIVKFHTLADTDGAGAQHHNFLLIRQDRIILTGVGRVEVRNVSTGMAGIHHAEHREQIVLLTEIVHIQLAALPHTGHILVAEAHLLGGGQDLQIAHIGLQGFFHIHNPLDGFQEERGNLGDGVNLFHTDAPGQQLRNGVDVIVPEL